MAIATGQFTISDMNDAPSLNGFISTNTTKTQGFNPDSGSYSPDFTKINATLKAHLFKSGTSADLLDTGTNISQMQWSRYHQESETWVNISSATTRQLVVDSNLGQDEHSRQYKFTCKFTEPSSGLWVNFSTTIEFAKVINGTGVADAVILMPNGNTFKNGSSNVLKLECQLWIGSSVSSKVTDAHFKWFKMDTAGSGNSAWEVPTGWREVTTGKSFNTTEKTSVLAITASDIVNIGVYMCVVDDPDTPNFFKDTATIIDQNDPILVTIDSTGGSVFKNNSGSSVLTAKLFQNGAEIDTTSDAGNYKYSYKWSKYKNDGSKDSTFNPSNNNTKKAKSISVTHSDVDIKATFVVEIS